MLAALLRVFVIVTLQYNLNANNSIEESNCPTSIAFSLGKVDSGVDLYPLGI